MKRFFSPDMLAVYMAMIAIVLSQLPPFYEYFQEPKPVVTIDGWLTVTHGLGHPKVFMPITISNDGPATLTVEKASCTLKHKGNGKLWPMKVVSYVDQSNVQQFAPIREIPFGRLRIPQGSQWSEVVNCLFIPTADQLSKAKKISREMQDFINATPFNPNELERIEFPKPLWLPAKNMFEKVFNLSAGVYTIDISLVTDSEKPLLRYTSSEFTLEEEDIALLTRHVDEYKYGVGLVFPTKNTLVVDKILNK